MNRGFDYLIARGVSEVTIRDFGFLYYDGKQFFSSKDSMAIPFIGKIKELFNTPERIEKFTDSVIIPILDLYGNFVSIISRRLNAVDNPKYDGVAYDKSLHIFGLNRTCFDVMKCENIFLTEGVFDFLTMYYSGITNSAAVLGCSMSEFQIILCKRFTNKFTLVFDPDLAGKHGMQKTERMIKSLGGVCDRVFIPAPYDLDTFLLKKGKEEFLKLWNVQ